nr:peptidase [Pseudomonadota bacterium]
MAARPVRSLLVLASSLALGACAYGYDDYGYGGVSAAYGSGWCDPYWDDCYGYYDPWYGWYDGYYYPGWGIYIYDQWRRPHRWTDRHRRFW